MQSWILQFRQVFFLCLLFLNLLYASLVCFVVLVYEFCSFCSNCQMKVLWSSLQVKVVWNVLFHFRYLMTKQLQEKFQTWLFVVALKIKNVSGLGNWDTCRFRFFTFFEMKVWLKFHMIIIFPKVFFLKYFVLKFGSFNSW